MEYFFDWFMDKGISVGFNGFYAVVLGTVGATMFTLAVLPRVAATVVEDMALPVAEGRADAVFAVGLFGAIERAAAHLGSEVSAGNAKNLLGHNMVDALLQVGDLLFET